MFELMQDIKPVHVMQLPHLNNSDSAFKLWADELRRLRSFLEEQLQVKITDQAIWDAIDLVNRETAAMKAVCDLNQAPFPPLSGLEMLTVTWSRSFNTDKEETIAMLNQLRESLKARGGNTSRTGARILLTGCPVGLGTEKVVKLVEELGAQVVVMENCSGYKTMELQTDMNYDDPIEALAHKYLKVPCSCMSPNPYRQELLAGMIKDFRVDAVIDLTWQACHTYNIEAYAIGRLVRGQSLPYLHLESDYSNSDLEPLKVRIEAMLEMVEK
jgi:benzoyl-CoA reductase/2-hydroxyglutaryl-CoA dehydratase subunit BcrC/BadD/HgdB